MLGATDGDELWFGIILCTVLGRAVGDELWFGSMLGILLGVSDEKEIGKVLGFIRGAELGGNVGNETG